MNDITVSRRDFETSSVFGAIGFGRLRASWQGMMSGLQAYRVYSDLEAMSDAQLDSKGLDRSDLPALAMKSITDADETLE